MSPMNTIPLKEQTFMMGGQDKYVVVTESKALNEWEAQITDTLKARGVYGETQVRKPTCVP